MEFKSNFIIFLLLIGGYTDKVKTTTTQSTQTTRSATAPATTSTTTNTPTATTTPSPTTSQASKKNPSTTASEPKTNGTVDYTMLPPGQREVAGVEMYFREGPSLSSAPVFSVYLGDAFYMFIKYTGSYHVIKPMECKAYAGVVIDQDVTNMVLWNSANCSTVSGVLERFINVNNTLLLATLYGFQFHQSPYVTIECTVSICNPNSHCTESKLCQGTRRRRMMAHNPSSIGKKSFRVVSGARNTGRPYEISSLWLYTFYWMFAFVFYIQFHY